MRAAANCACRWRALVATCFDGITVTLVTRTGIGSGAMSGAAFEKFFVDALPRALQVRLLGLLLHERPPHLVTPRPERTLLWLGRQLAAIARCL
jgi:hypothetical protein